MLQNTQTYKQVWQECLDLIRVQITDEEFVRWIKPIVPVEFDGSVLRLGVPDRSFAAQLDHEYIAFLRPIIAKFYGEQTRLIYSIPKADVQKAAQKVQVSNQTKSQEPKNPFATSVIKRMSIDPNLNKYYTFDNFVEGECNRLPRSAAMAVAVDPGNTPFNPLYIYGNSGLGKTHVVQAVGHEVRKRHPEMSVLYVSMNKFQAQFQTAYLNGEIPDFIHFYQSIDVLIIDDIQELTGKTGTQNAFFNIFNHLQMSGKQIILTSDKAPVELADIEQRLLTRFKWGFATQVNLPDYETKLRIIRAKAKKHNAIVPDEVVEYLASNISASVREIEGSLSSLIANASFMNRDISVSLAKEILTTYVRIKKKEINVSRIVDVVCDTFGVSLDQINSSVRTREVAQARQAAMYLAKQHTKLSLSGIGSAVGKRNHATVLHACKAVTNLLETDKNFARQLEAVEKIILL